MYEKPVSVEQRIHFFATIKTRGRGGVSIRIRNGLDGSGLEPRWKQEILSSPHPSSPALWPTQLTLQWVPGLFPREKWSGRGIDQRLSSNAEVSAWHITRRPFTFTIKTTKWLMLYKEIIFFFF